jgi:eukaryotic-like serine/threonine-protein kinase
MSAAQVREGDIVGGRYVVGATLGQTAALTSYLAYDSSLNRDVELHVFAPRGAADLDFLGRFRDEAQRVAGLHHPHLVRVFDSGEEALGAYLVTEHPAGGSLRALLGRQGVVSERQAARFGAEVADALAYVHARGMVHGAVSPDTILFDAEGRAKIADLGFAAVLQGSPVGAATDARYASPEQARAQSATGATDVYALGLTLFEAITGQSPFLGATAADTLQHRLGVPLPAHPAVKVLDMTLALAAAPDAGARPTADQLAARLEAATTVASDEPSVTAPPTRTSAGFSAPTAENVLWGTPTDPARSLSEGIELQRATPTGGAPEVTPPFAGEEPRAPALPTRRRGQVRATRRRRLATTLVTALVVLSTVGVGTAWKLGYFLKQATVPSLVGLNAQQALTLLGPDGFTLRITSSVPSPTAAAGVIVTQVPLPGRTLRQGAVVNVEVSSGVAFVSLPTTLTGVDCSTATAFLASIGVGATCPSDLSEPSATLAKGLVVAALYNGTRNPSRVPGGATVQLVLSQGPTPTTTVPNASTTTVPTSTTVAGHAARAVPNLVGLSRSATFAAMKQAELYYVTHGPGSSGGTWTVVLSQSPAPGTMLRWHGTVTLQVK